MLIAIEATPRGITPTYVAGFERFLRSTAVSARARRHPHPRAGHRQAPRRDGEEAARRSLLPTVPVFDVSMTDPCPASSPSR
jgi:hypothetical protein